MPMAQEYRNKKSDLLTSLTFVLKIHIYRKSYDVIEGYFHTFSLTDFLAFV